MSEKSLKKGTHDNKFSQLVRFWRREGKKYCAIALCASLIAGNLGYVAAAASEDPDYCFELDSTLLYEAFQDAVANDQILESNLDFHGEDSGTYDSLLEANGSLYELTPEIEDNDGDVQLRIFVRVGENSEIDLDSLYQVDGSEEIIFLLTNTSKSEQTAVVVVDNKITEEITIAPKKSVRPGDETDPYRSAGDVIVAGEATEAGNTEVGSAGPSGADNAGYGGSVFDGFGDGSGNSGGENGGGSGSGSGSGHGDSENGDSIDQEDQTGPSQSVDIVIDPSQDVKNPDVKEETFVEVETPEQNEDPVIQPDEEKNQGTDALVPDADQAIDENGSDEEEIGSDVVGDKNSYADAKVDDDVENGSDENDSVDSGADTNSDDPENNSADDSDTSLDTSSDYGSDKNDAGDSADNASSDNSADTADADDGEVIAAISYHKIWKVASAVTASPSNATPSNADEEAAEESFATDFNATDSNAAKEEIEGITYDTVGLERGSAVAFVTTAEALGLPDAEKEYVAELDEVTVKVTAPFSAFSVPVELSVTPLSEDSNDEEVAEKYLKAKEELIENEVSTEGMVAFDICFLDKNGEEVEPDGEVLVEFEMNSQLLPDEVDKDALVVWHHDEQEDGTTNVQGVARTAILAEESDIDATVMVTDGLVETTDDKVVAAFSVDGFSTYSVSTYAGPGSGGSMVTSGNFDHIEIEITGRASFVVEGVTYTENVSISTDDTFTVTAYTLNSSGNKETYTGFDFSSVTDGDGSTNSDTVELSGSYPTGTFSSPVYYVVSLIKDVTFTLNDGSEMTVPVTLTVTTQYWDSGNHCPGIANNSNWEKGYFVRRSGIDVPVSGTAVGQAITKGKLAIKKIIFEDDSDTTKFTFTIQNLGKEYLTFDSNNAYTGTSENLTNDCYVTVNGGSNKVLTDIPEGVYRITEIQKEGYIITDTDGNKASNYTVDYTVETKDDDSIPIATFTNKKLEDEAGISIKKTASGLTSGTAYPNPTVSIYAVDENGNKTGDAVWTGTLIANGDTLYLNTTLAEGTYIIEESGQTVDGYSCVTTISGGSTVNGMKFTVVGGTRYDLIVNNVYTAKTSIVISKTVTGNWGNQKKDFTFTVVLKDSEGNLVDFPAVGDGESYTVNSDGTATIVLSHGESITIDDIPIGVTVIVTETGSDGYTPSYVVTRNNSTVSSATGTKSGNLSATTEATKSTTYFAFTNNNEAEIDTGVLLDSLPYILILAAVIAGAAFYFIRKKKEDEDDLD